eukprot:10164-Heterococcus_DN1.PRE.1
MRMMQGLSGHASSWAMTSVCYCRVSQQRSSVAAAAGVAVAFAAAVKAQCQCCICASTAGGSTVARSQRKRTAHLQQ